MKRISTQPYLMSFDCSMHSTGIALFDPFDDIVATNEVTLGNKIKEERACIKMINDLLEILNCYMGLILSDEEFEVVCEIQKPHKKDRMSVQAFAHTASIPIAILGYLKFRNVKHHMYTPMQWKKNVEKEVCLQRIYANEVLNMTDPNLFSMKTPDILDAIGLGRYHLEQVAYKERTGQK